MSKENNKISNQCNEISNCNQDKITKRRGDPVDVYVGSRIREKRVILGMSQEKLGSQLGISLQQVQKYEKGINRIASSRLHEIAEILKVHVSYFFQHYDDLSDILKVSKEDKDLEKYILKTAGLFENIKDDELRKKIFLGSKNVYDSVILATKCTEETNKEINEETENEIETDGLNEPNDESNNNQQGEL
ncbi:MAG TPA: helix-turn-helix transcriptional regulator [Rickettsiales bacterium]|nr:helix-turn-helix transcriptional regulator [Rickettsiales bacterium]